MRKCNIFRSDAWDSGNYLTRFYEVHERCPECEGIGEIEVEVYDEEKDVVRYETADCPLCGASGTVIRYE